MITHNHRQPNSEQTQAVELVIPGGRRSVSQLQFLAILFVAVVVFMVLLWAIGGCAAEPAHQLPQP
jgi:hypothetical protein